MYTCTKTQTNTSPLSHCCCCGKFRVGARVVLDPFSSSHTCVHEEETLLQQEGLPTHIRSIVCCDGVVKCLTVGGARVVCMRVRAHFPTVLKRYMRLLFGHVAAPVCVYIRAFPIGQRRCRNGYGTTVVVVVVDAVSWADG